MAGIISSFHEGNKKNFLIDVDAAMGILSTEGIAGQNKQKHPISAHVEGIAGQKQAKIPNQPARRRV